MVEPMAWYPQALADRQAAESLMKDLEGTGSCHAIAKWQQAVEKTIKALVFALEDAGILGGRPRPRHEVFRYLHTLTHLPRGGGTRTIQHRLHGLLDQKTREGIRALDSLAPQLPPRRNTEYPFQDAHAQWTFPAADGEFSQAEVDQFRELTHRILDRAGAILSAIRRRPG